ncbi:SDR family NAD(P)-dependent oxidoreductase [Dyadobacter fanqingshengii]|uniref:SDR family oxidoreductase n=1 Tax=Dyadobacter fanqingshengii TaxID=2906443 RepID=A0A9X1PFB9_9BACT|nr:SDR family oxidoreductase [Dyadobacter fanqingshengii]MCF0042207.1 SDR family oxidoreductase [Dyadobacter fanqingshengii]MCF2506402.1 SDR family oxidoreductase [Dyadobacter fanqingshengii]USJ35262.1 SDR family oxidoreductase [Dyadobacter fanqingshengii]
MDLQLKGKTAFISGSTQGIGFAIAQNLLKEGANVVINGRTQSKVEDAVQRLQNDNPAGSVSGIAADFSKVEEVNALLESLPEIDILVNNAGIFEPQAFTDITDESWFKFFEVNVLSGVRLSRHYFPKMIARDWGRIIFISSESAVNIPEEMIHYGMTKTAQLAVSRGLSELTKGTNVTVNSVLPGPTKSEGVAEFVKQLGAANQVSSEQAEKDFFKDARPTSLLQRFTSVEEIANLVTYVASPLSSGTNGAALKVDGGVAKFII